jgi:hypothetical protein
VVGIVNIVHAVDTEGPIYESVFATFERLEEILGIKIKPSVKNLIKIRKKEIDLGSKSLNNRAANFVSENKLNYLSTWKSINEMVKEISKQEIRSRITDSFGGGWVCTWFCLDLVGFKNNPRKKDMGFHKVFDKYLKIRNKLGLKQDELQFHFHPMTTYKEAHRFATSFVNSPDLHPGLARKIIERKFFPNVFRPGFHAERPDSNWFLEQWIPFDLGNQSTEIKNEKSKLGNLSGGRLGDWRGAPSDWSIYNPSHDDWRKEGNCRRFIGRCLNMNARHSNLTIHEISKAFEKAKNGENVLLAFTNHDFRDMKPEILKVQDMILEVSNKYKNIKFKFSKASDAFRNVIWQRYRLKKETLKLRVELRRAGNNLRLHIKEKYGDVFGPQPFLAIQTKNNRFIHDNLDFGLNSSNKNREWFYTFDNNTVPKIDLKKIGVAANDKFGNTFVKVLNVK